MKNWNLAALVPALFLTGVFAQGVGGAAKDAVAINLIVNPSLEEPVGSDGLPAGWARFADPADGYRASVVNEGRTGSHSLHIEGAGQYGGVVTNRHAIDRARGYAARGWCAWKATRPPQQP